MKVGSKKENKKPIVKPKAELKNLKSKNTRTKSKPTESGSIKKNVVEDMVNKVDASTQCSTNEIGVNTENIEEQVVVNKIEESVKVEVEEGMEDKDLFVRYRKMKNDSPNAQRRMKQTQIMQEELKRQIEEKRLQKELEKKRMKEEAEREELRIQNEKRELVLKYQTECTVSKTAPKKTNKLFEPSEDNWFAAPSPKSHQPINVLEAVKEKPLDLQQVAKEYEKRIKQLEVEKDNAIKMAMDYKEKLIRERTRKGNLVQLEEDI